MSTYEEVRKRFQLENKMNIFEQAVEDACQKIMRQTDYDKDKSLQKLKEHDLDIIRIVREWMGVSIKKEKKRTTNQMVFAEFRSFLDKAANNYYKKKEAEENQKAYLQSAAAAELRRREALAEEDINKPSTLETIQEVSDEQKTSTNSSNNISCNPNKKHQ